MRALIIAALLLTAAPAQAGPVDLFMYGTVTPGFVSHPFVGTGDVNWAPDLAGFEIVGPWTFELVEALSVSLEDLNPAM